MKSENYQHYTKIYMEYHKHPHKITLKFDSRGQLVEENSINNWLLDNMGDAGFRWRVIYGFTYNTYHFRDDSDCVLFALRWS